MQRIHKALAYNYAILLLALQLGCTTTGEEDYKTPEWIDGCTEMNFQEISPVHSAVFYYAAPNGGGSVCSQVLPCSLVGVRDFVRSINSNMTTDIVIYLRGGTYALSTTFLLEENAVTHDSGTNGYNIEYRAYPGETPMLSGGQSISGWTLFDVPKNIFRVFAGVGLQTRQVYINGVRAIRARGSLNPVGFSKSANGFTGPDASLSSWNNIADIEIVSYNAWKAMRYPFASVIGSEIVLQQPCWNNTQSETAYISMDNVAWVENAYELLDSDGEWYYDRTSGYLYYKPRSGENMAVANTVMALTETLVNLRGQTNLPIHNIHFTGITFAYATWIAPNSNNGYADYQAGFHITGSDVITKTPGNITLQWAQLIRFENNIFAHLGGAALTIESESQYNTVIGNIFTDISSTAIQLGDITDNAVSIESKKIKNHIIKDNFISSVAVEYQGAVGIWIGYAKCSRIDHNEIQQLSYTGISAGWGWGTESYSFNTQITHNHLHHLMSILDDGGGIYTLSPQPNSFISSNYIHDLAWGLPNANRNGLYHDAGSAYFVDTDNVISNVSKWLVLQTQEARAEHNFIWNTFVDSSRVYCCSINNVVDGIHLFNGIKPPAEANRIVETAGLESSFLYLISKAIPY